MGNPFDALTLEDLRRRRSEKWRTFQPDVLPVWLAEMDYPLAEPIQRILAEMVTRGDTGYVTRAGLPEAYAAFAARTCGLEVDPSRVSVVLDVMRGVHLALELFTAPGDGVVVNPPVYAPFFRTIAFAGRRVIEAPLAFDSTTGRWELDLDALGRAFDQGARAYLLCSPHNPVGRVWSRDELSAAAELADRHGLMVIADEVHAALTYPDVAHVPFGSLDRPAARRAVTLTSASKAWNLAGLKCALAVTSSAETGEAFRRLPDEVHEEPSIFGVAANEVAFRDGGPWLHDVLSYLDANRRRLGELLAQRLPAVRWAKPEATYLAWLDCRTLDLGDDPAAVLLERGRVALSPGVEFGTGGARFARLNFATSRAIVEEAVERMATALS